MIPWHRLLGMTMANLFKGSCLEVESEVDLSLKAQRLDLLLLRKNEGVMPAELPDGLEVLERFNLITYKSINEPLDPFAIHELVGHYTNCRKIFTTEEVSPNSDGKDKSSEKKRASDEFQLFGLTTAYPKKLASETLLKRVSEGVYDIMAVGKRVRIIVLSEIPDAPRNGLWNLFSARQEKVVHGAAYLNLEDRDLSSILNELLNNYQIEEISMPYTIEDFRRDAQKEVLSRLTLEQRLAGLTPEQQVTGLTPEQRLAGLTPEQQVTGLTPAQLASMLTPAQLASMLTPAQLASMLTPAQLASMLTPAQHVTGLTPAQLASTLSPEVFRQLAKEMKKKNRKP